MRVAPYIDSIWSSGGPFIGDAAQPHSRVTVQLPWSDLSGKHKYDVLRSAYTSGTGNYKQRGVPLRWFQNKANDQTELEVPNLKQIHTRRAIDQDAAQMDLTLYNQQMFTNAESPLDATEAGQPGYFSFNRGVSLDSQARWSQSKNIWENLLVPNALLRTYQGYGGTNKSIPQALTDGNIILTGVWLVDTVEINSDGTLKLQARDMAKLLIDQQLYPPLVPPSEYPLTYYRWQYFNVPVQAQATTVTTTTQAQITPGHKTTTYETSSVDAWYDNVYGHDMSLHGHHPSDAFDGNPDTYFLGEGNSRPDAVFAVNYLQAICGEQMNSVFINPWAGNYTMYVSVMENGAWQGTATVPYDPSPLFGTQPYAVDTGAAIPYVASFGVPWETAQEYVLPRVYLADRVRVSFRDLTYTDWGPWHYRAGIREFDIRAGGGASTSSTTSVTYPPLFIAAESDPVSGYVTASTNFQVDAFGAARIQAMTGGQAESSDSVWAMCATPTGKGYYLLTHTGRITTYGDAVYHGDPKAMGFGSAPLQPGLFDNANCTDIAITNTGAGYWVLDTSGKIWSFGDAANYAAIAPTNNGGGTSWATSIDGHKTAMGLFIVDANGKVSTRGAAVSAGDLSPMFDAPLRSTVPVVTKIRSTATSDGYWLLASNGQVQALGGATHFGQPVIDDTYDSSWFQIYWDILPHADGSGYLVLRGTGLILDFGVSNLTWDYGSPIPGQVAQQRKDGNYLDYTDIIKDLALWSGFTFYDPLTPSNAAPDVYGNLESTGAWSPEPLPTAEFDKKPVIDAMHAIKETVGYLLWVDEEGAFRFEAPNWWAPGNFDEFGVHTSKLPFLDEKNTLITYTATVADDPLRSMIIISSEDPDAGVQTNTITTRLIPSTVQRLRGLVKPAMWVNGYFLRHEEQLLMAELIALHTYFQSRLGQVTCSANPILQINDQVRVWERQTADTYIHYVRGIETTHDLDAGAYTMTVTTNWMGDETNWAIQAQGTATSFIDPDDPYVYLITPALQLWLAGSSSAAAALFSRVKGGTSTGTLTSYAPLGSQPGTGSAS